MPITLHDFNENFVLKSTGLPAFGRACSTLGLSLTEKAEDTENAAKRLKIPCFLCFP